MARDLAYRSVAHSQVSMCSERRKDKIPLLTKKKKERSLNHQQREIKTQMVMIL